jgi:ParB-like chromosome segregation protein Spo0J
MKQKWPSDKVQRRKISELIPYARNARTHSDEQVAQLAASIKEWGWTTPVLIDEAGEIIAGHGRVMAARKLGIEEIPTMTATGWSKAQKQAYVLADNQLPQNAGWDMDLLKIEMQDLGEDGFDIDIIGFHPSELNFDEIDYSVLDDKNEIDDALDEMEGDVKKAIQIEFEAEHYEEAQETIKWWRDKKAYVGYMILKFLKEERDKA